MSPTAAFLKPNLRGRQSSTSSTDALLGPQPSVEASLLLEWDPSDNRSPPSKSPASPSGAVGGARSPSLMASVQPNDPSGPISTSHHKSMSASTPNIALPKSTPPNPPLPSVPASSPKTAAEVSALPASTPTPVLPTSSTSVPSSTPPQITSSLTAEERAAKRRNRNSVPANPTPREDRAERPQRERDPERERLARVRKEADAAVRQADPDPRFGVLLGLNASQHSLASASSKDVHSLMSHTSTFTGGTSATASPSMSGSATVPPAPAVSAASESNLSLSKSGQTRPPPLKACNAAHVRLQKGRERRARKEMQQSMSSATSLPLKERSTNRAAASRDNVHSRTGSKAKLNSIPAIQEKAAQDAEPYPVSTTKQAGGSPYGSMKPLAAKSEAYITQPARYRQNRYSVTQIKCSDDEDDYDNDKSDKFLRLRKALGLNDANAKNEPKVMRWVRNTLVKSFGDRQ